MDEQRWELEDGTIMRWAMPTPASEYAMGIIDMLLDEVDKASNIETREALLRALFNTGVEKVGS